MPAFVHSFGIASAHRHTIVMILQPNHDKKVLLKSFSLVCRILSDLIKHLKEDYLKNLLEGKQGSAKLPSGRVVQLFCLEKKKRKREGSCETCSIIDFC